MKIAAVPETLLERLITLLGRAPTPIIDTFHAVIVARTVMVATKLGVFEALADGPRTAPEVAGALGVDERATEKLLNVLVATRYLRFRDERYALAQLARRWLLREPVVGARQHALRFMEWQAVESLEDFVRTGRPLDVHAMIRDDEWAVYQRGMRALARLSADEVVRRVPVPAAAVAMLDVGGGHGHYAVAFCRRYPQLRATILDLPAAVEAAAPILAETAINDRVTYRAGDVTTDELGENAWDLVFTSHVVHHFDEATNAVVGAARRTGFAAGGRAGDSRRSAAGIAHRNGPDWRAARSLLSPSRAAQKPGRKRKLPDGSAQAGLRPDKRIALRSAPA